MTFSLTNGGLRGVDGISNKEEQGLHILLELRGNYVLGVITSKAKQEFEKARGWRPQLWGGVCFQAERLPCIN